MINGSCSFSFSFSEVLLTFSLFQYHQSKEDLRSELIENFAKTEVECVLQKLNKLDEARISKEMKSLLPLNDSSVVKMISIFEELLSFPDLLESQDLTQLFLQV